MMNEMRDRHLVTDNPQGMIESMLNFAYAKNEKVYLRYANGTEDIDLCEYVAQFTETNGCMLSADDVMKGSCIEGCDCEMAILYTLGVQAAELRERLKYYENLEERELLQTFPCKVGDTVYYINRFYHIELRKDTIYKAKVVRIVTTSLGTSLVIQIRGEHGCTELSNIDCVETPNIEDFSKTVFLTKSEAEQKLKEMRGGINA